MTNAIDAQEKKEDLLRGWHRGRRILQIGNFAVSTYFGKLGKRFGVAVVVATTIVGSTIFATMGESQYQVIQFAAGFVSVVATVPGQTAGRG